MTHEEAVRMLREMYDSAPSRDKMLAVYLFGIKYADDLKASRLSTDDLSREALGRKLGPTINAGIKLAGYVELKGGK